MKQGKLLGRQTRAIIRHKRDLIILLDIYEQYILYVVSLN